MGITKFYWILIGKDYVRLIESDLTAGASAKDKKVLSKSSVKVNSHIIYSCGKKECYRENVGYFTSENDTDKDKSKSKHHGYLKV